MPVLFEMGLDFLYVDGHCHYWVQGPPADTANPTVGYYIGIYQPYREGGLTVEQEQSLHDAVGYDDFAASGPTCPTTSVSDPTAIELWDGKRVHVCFGRPAGVDVYWPMRLELFNRGTPMNGDLRIEVGRESVPDGRTIYPWPLAAPPMDYAVSDLQSTTSGRSTLISDPQDKAALRSLREELLTELSTSGYFFGIILVEPKGYVLALRDHLPFANPADGLWAPPQP
jgi:hypothetical protein